MPVAASLVEAYKVVLQAWEESRPLAPVYADVVWTESQKFTESDWIRNRGRFADYVGRGGGGGRAGGAGTDGEGIDQIFDPKAATPKRKANAEKWLKDQGYTPDSLYGNARTAFDDASAKEKADGLVWYEDAHNFSRDLAERSGRSVDETAGIVAVLSPQADWETNKKAAQIVIDVVDSPTFTLTQAEVDRRFEGGMEYVRDYASPAKKDSIIARIHREREEVTPWIGTRPTASIPTPILARIHKYNAVAPNVEKAIEIARREKSTRQVLGESDGAFKIKSFYDNIARPRSSQAVTIDTHMINRMATGGERAGAKVTQAVFSNDLRYQAFSEPVTRIAREEGLLPHQVQAVIWNRQRR